MRCIAPVVLSLVISCTGERAASVSRPLAADRDGGSTPLSWVDFTVADCPRYDPAVPSCTGSAPLALRFAAVAPGRVDSYLWSFGDAAGQSAVSSTPAHRFELPGSYAVSLVVGGQGGTAQVRRDGFVVVRPAALGGRCDQDGQCASGLSCVCGRGCPGMTERGVCSRACSDAAPCPSGATCVDLGPRGGPATGDDAWPASACLRACAGDADCDGGDACRDLPAIGAPENGWTRACFPPDVLGDEGASCFGAGGLPDDRSCLGGRCAALGARGMCAATCDAAHPCPPYALCASFADGSQRCLARCQAARPCDSDPFLGCQTSNLFGRLGFIAAEDTSARLCAPKRCSSNGACGPDGTCTREFCSVKSN